jgi:hypothetical protein
MRSPALLVGYIPILIACGGQGAREGAQSPEPASTTAPAGSSASGGAPPSASAPGPTTTTATLGDGGDLQGAKLTETRTVASTPADAGAPSKTPHSHDPGRGPADIKAIVVAHRDEARACYDKALADHPGIEGDLVITWTIDPKGNVTQTAVDSSRSQIAEPTVVACVSELVKKVQFAPSPGGFETKAFYPFNFHPRHTKP